MIGLSTNQPHIFFSFKQKKISKYKCDWFEYEATHWEKNKLKRKTKKLGFGGSWVLVFWKNEEGREEKGREGTAKNVYP